MARAVYVWDTEQKKLVQVSTDFVPTARQGPRVDLYMDGIRATDGTDISSKRKRREYMKRNNLTDFSDFKGKWEKDARERVEEPQSARRERREDIARTAYELSQRRR